MPPSMFHDHDRDDDEDDRQMHAVIDYMVRAYCSGREIPHDCRAIVVHAHEDGTPADRLLVLHVATGPLSAARLAVHSLVADLTSATFPAGAKGGPR